MKNLLDIVANSVRGKGLKNTARQLARMSRTVDRDLSKYHNIFDKYLTLENDRRFYDRFGDKGIEVVRDARDLAENLLDKRYNQRGELRPAIASLYNYDFNLFKDYDEMCRKKWKKGKDYCTDSWYGGGFEKSIPSEQEVILDPMNFIDSPYPIVRDMARKLVSGEDD